MEEASRLVCFPRGRVTAADLDNRCGFRLQLLQSTSVLTSRLQPQLGPSVSNALPRFRGSEDWENPDQHSQSIFTLDTPQWQPQQFSSPLASSIGMGEGIFFSTWLPSPWVAASSSSWPVEPSTLQGGAQNPGSSRKAGVWRVWRNPESWGLDPWVKHRLQKYGGLGLHPQHTPINIQVQPGDTAP